MLARVELGIVGRTRGEGRAGSAVAAAAYNASVRLTDCGGRTFDYSRKAREHAGGCVILPPGAPPGLGTPEALWLAAEACERRSDAQIARQLLISIPREIDSADRLDFARAMVAPYVTDGMGAQVDIHCPGAADGGEQPHAHVLLTMRRVTDAGMAPTKAREWNTAFREGGGKAERARLSARATAWMAAHGVAGGYDLRSLADRGEDHPPEPTAPRADWQRWQRDGADPAAAPPAVSAVLVHRSRRAALARAEAARAQASGEVAALARLAAAPVPAAPALPPTTSTEPQEDTMPAPRTPAVSRRHRASWTTRQGGLDALPDALRSAATSSHERWTDGHPDRKANHPLSDYVAYVQGKRAEEPTAPTADDDGEDTHDGQVPAPLPAGGSMAPADKRAGQTRRAQHLAALLAGRYPSAPPDLAAHLWRMDTDETVGLTRLHLRGGGTVIDHGDRLTHDGDTTPAVADAIAAAAAAHGWPSVRLTGSDDYRDAVAIACAMRSPPITTDHLLSSAARDRLTATQVRRATAAVPALDARAVAAMAAGDPRAAGEAHVQNMEARARAALAGMPTGATSPHEISGPRVAAMETRRDAAIEDAAEAAEAAAGHRAQHGWATRIVPGPARRRQAALDTEAARLGREARTLESGHGRAVRAVEKSARREAAATADAVETWRWSPGVRRAERDLAAAGTIRAALAGSDPATIEAAARGDLRTAGRTAGAYAEQTSSPESRAIRRAGASTDGTREALDGCRTLEGRADGPAALAAARAITAAVVAGDHGTVQAMASADADGAGEAATAWRRRGATQKPGQAMAPADPTVTHAFAR